MKIPLRTRLTPFLDTRVGVIFLLGAVSGLPWVMIGSALTIWLQESDISRTQIGYAGLIFGVYAINFLWAPLLDRVQPNLIARLGPRRNWILICQLIIAGMCFVMAAFSPEQGAKTLVLLALVIAIASATQDIAIDAFRVDAFSRSEPDKVSAAAAAATAGWWTGYAGLGFIPLFLSDHSWYWSQLYPLMGLITLALSLCLFIGPPPPARPEGEHQARHLAYLTRVSQLNQRHKWQLVAALVSPLLIAVWAVAGSPGLPASITDYPLFVPAIVGFEVALLVIVLMLLSRVPDSTYPHPELHGTATLLERLPASLLSNVIAPLEEFFKRNGLKLGLSILGFIVIFKLGEAFLGRMSVVFYKEIGFSNSEIATYSKMLTWGVTVAAAIPCGLLNARLGVIRGLFISGVFMAASNLMFAVIARVGPDLNWYFAAVVVDGLTTAWGSIAFVAFISLLCSHAFSATQYALMASLGTLGRSTVAAFSGQMVDGLGGNWALFFVLTTLMVIPGLLLLWWLRVRLQIQLNRPDPKPDA